MSVLRTLAAMAAAIIFAGSAAAAPLDAYGKLPTIETGAVSPSGASVALIVTNGEDRAILVRNVATQATTLKVGTGTAKVRSLLWAGEKHLIIVTTAHGLPLNVATTQREWTFAFSLDVDTRKVSPLLRDVDKGLDTILDVPVVRPFEGEPTVFVQGVRFVDNAGRLSLFRVDLDTGRSHAVEIGSKGTSDWLVGPHGEALAQEFYEPDSGRWALKVKSGGTWREAVSATALTDPPSLMGLGPDGSTVMYSSRDADGRAVWRLAPLDGGPEPAPIRVAGGPLNDRTSARLIGQFEVVGDEHRYTYFDKTDAANWQAVVGAFPGATVDLVSTSDDRTLVLAHVDSPQRGPAYALVDLNTRHATWLGPEYEGVQPDDVAPQKRVRFKARDGLDLMGYLTLPKGREPKGLPLIVFPHGGPASRDAPGFDWWAQGMASRGYAVLQVNFRGSDGLGEALLQAGYGEWGRKMQTDLSDAVKAVAGTGIVDPKRVCIVGASYGGYAALAGAALDPGVYRCAASVGGLSDLRRFVSWSKEKNGVNAFRYWTRFMGAADSRDSALAEISPAMHVERVTIPVLLIHGKDDSVVPLEQSQIMAEALKKAGKPVELIVQKGEDHWLSRGDTRLQTLTATMAFVEKNNPPN
jgi:cephalosporin-C deacetylase-like acetyl esterase